MLREIYRASRRSPLSSWLPWIMTAVAFVSTAAIGFEKLSGIEEAQAEQGVYGERLAAIEEILKTQTTTMERLEGALTFIQLVDQRVVTLEDWRKVQESETKRIESEGRKDLRRVETVARDNKTAVRLVAHDVKNLNTLLLLAGSGKPKGE